MKLNAGQAPENAAIRATAADVTLHKSQFHREMHRLCAQTRGAMAA